MKSSILIFAFLFSCSAYSQDSSSPLVSFDDYERLMLEVKEHRKTRLVDLNTFNLMSSLEDVYILDTRSKEMYDRKHVKGAIHLNFSDFTQENLDALFPNRDVTILIYCNNNFMDDVDLSNIVADLNFASKVFRPVFVPQDVQSLNPQSTLVFQTSDMKETLNNAEVETMESTIVVQDDAITLALNIPTYINLFGYGYKNVYELSELVSIHDSRIQFEGTEVLEEGN